MCFSDPIDNHGVPQASWLIYLADQRPRHRKNYGKGGRYGTQVRATGGGWRGRNDPRYTPTPPADHRGDPGDGGDGLVYPPAPRQGRGGGGGRVRVPPGVNAGRGHGGASVASGGPRRAAREPAPRGGQGEEPAAPVVRDFGAERGGGGEDAAPGMGFDLHTVRTATVLSNSSSGVGSRAGAGAGRSRAGAGTGVGGRGGGDDGQIPVREPPVSPPSSVAGSTHSRGSHRSGSGRHAEGAPGMRSRSRHGSVSSSGTYRSGGGSRSGSESGSGHGRRVVRGERLGRVSEASGEAFWDDG